GERRWTSSPSTRTSPASGASAPLSTLISVVLPAPFGPIRPWTTPPRRARSTPRSACTPPKLLATPDRRMSVASREAGAPVVRPGRSPPAWRTHHLGEDELTAPAD